MYLKEIEVSGFKSFADKLNIKLDNNITCIVGPNGSGKSNVVDAVRWVLGEQSVKSLRGDGSMSDVIFSGSKTRGALQSASVSLIFDNSDNYLQVPYTEVSIKRRIYKTGENEYFLNGEKCRLKDILDLFMDSGIGKTSFNIISQGEVMRILSTSPYDRRVIFEEAASVLKYKKRKDEAIRKLERTNQNMERVEDIINELELQVKPLEEQSKKAKEYKDAKEKLESIEVGLLAVDITSINDVLNKKKDNIDKINKEIISLSSTSSVSGSKIDSKRLELLKLEGLYKEENTRLLELTREVEKLNGERKILEERSKYDAKDAKVHENLLAIKTKKMNLENEIFDLEKSLENEKYFLNEMAKEESKLNEEISKIYKRREDLLREYNLKSKEYLELKNKINVLENTIENGGNISNSVKAVLNNPRLVGIHDYFANLLEVDSKFAKALEVAIFSSKQSIVTDTMESAKSAINYLKDQKLGRATFFPLDSMKARYVDLDTMNILKQEEGFIDVFSSLVKYDVKYDNVVKNQLGNILVTFDLNVANKISKKIQNRYRIVTLDGEIINVGGSVTGGSINNMRSVISQKQELETLKVKRGQMKESILEIDNTLGSLDKERKELEDIIYKKKQDYMSKNVTFEEKVSHFSSKKSELAEVVKEISTLEHVVDSSLSKEEEKLMEEYSKKMDEKNTAVRTLEKLNLQKDLLSREIEEMDASNKVSMSVLRKKETESKNLEIEISKLDVKLDHFLNVLNEEYGMTYEHARDNYLLELDIDEAREKVGLYKSIIKRIGMVNLDSIEEYERVSERYNFLNSQREDLINAKTSLFEIISEMDEVMKEEFINTFNLIKEEFKKVFKELFGGGHADLHLTDPDNVLETGIEIVASPPGKKLTTISLLSGGEKTLTAISLLFAILNVRTVPFCLFDEVEAALDEANVDNFGKYLDTYKDKTQFLLITHKKKTMEYAKTLYGITMQESGVSKLVSVKFDNVM